MFRKVVIFAINLTKFFSQLNEGFCNSPLLFENKLTIFRRDLTINFLVLDKRVLIQFIKSFLIKFGLDFILTPSI